MESKHFMVASLTLAIIQEDTLLVFGSLLRTVSDQHNYLATVSTKCTSAVSSRGLYQSRVAGDTRNYCSFNQFLTASFVM